EHLRDLKSEVRRFFETELETEILGLSRISVAGDEAEFTPSSGIQPSGSLHRLVARAEIPPQWSILVGDFVQACRSALDYLAWELARHNLGRLPPIATAFTIAESSHEFRERAARQLASVSDEH